MPPKLWLRQKNNFEPVETEPIRIAYCSSETVKSSTNASNPIASAKKDMLPRLKLTPAPSSFNEENVGNCQWKQLSLSRLIPKINNSS